MVSTSKTPGCTTGVVATGALVLFACLGLARFAYTMLLPGMQAGPVIGGNGMEIIFAGFLIPPLNHGHGVDGWRMGWRVIGLIAQVAAACAALLLRSHTSDLGLEAIGRPQSGPRFTKPTGPQPGNECPPTILRQIRGPDP